jgi:hypothetical protein
MVNTAWTWGQVASKVQSPELKAHIHALDAVFRAKDVAIQYAITILMIIMTWTLIITVFASGHSVVDQRENIVRAFCLFMMVLALVFAICRMWIIKFDMLHPALSLIHGSGPAPAYEATRRYLLGMVIYFVVGICTAVAGAICLLGSAYKTQAVGVGLCVATTFVLTLTSVFYRWHAGVHMYAVGVSPAGVTNLPSP